MLKISANNYAAAFSPVGGELKSLTLNKKEAIWSGDSCWWGRSAPVLFPNIGHLLQDKASFNGNDIELPKHGFLREATLQVLEHDQSKVIFELDTETLQLKSYPFRFRIHLEYELSEHGLASVMRVQNIGDDNAYFNFGYHPAFNLLEGTEHSDYIVQFNKPVLEAYEMPNGLATPITQSVETCEIELNDGFFDNDARIYDLQGATSAILKSKSGGNSIELSAFDMPYLALWAPQGAPFVCVEPWHGLPDEYDSKGDYLDKKGLIKLKPSESYESNLNISVSLD